MCSAPAGAVGPPPWFAGAAPRRHRRRHGRRSHPGDRPADSRRRARPARPVGHGPPQRRRPSGRHPGRPARSRMHDRRDAPSCACCCTTARHPHPHLGAGRPHAAGGRHVAGRSGPPARPPRPDPDTFAAGVYEINRTRPAPFPWRCATQACPTSSPRSATACLPPKAAETLSTAMRHPGDARARRPRLRRRHARNARGLLTLPPGGVADAELGRDPVVTSLVAARSGDVDGFEQLRDDLGAPSELGTRHHHR